MNTAIKRVVIAGGSSIGFIAAMALRRTFKHTGLDVLVIDTPAEGTPPARWTLPSQRGAHVQIGLNEADFLRQADATYRLASELSGWRAPQGSFLLAHGEIGSPIDVTPFYKYLLARTLRGNDENPEAYSVGAVAARLGRFARPMGSGNELTAGFTYGYHLDEQAYIALLRMHADKAGVRRVVAGIADVRLNDSGQIASLALDNGETIGGDLFLDCTGTAARLLSRLDAGARIDWSRWLPCDRIAFAATPALAEPAALTRIAASDAGWVFQLPLAQRTFVGHVYPSAQVTDEAALQTLTRLAGKFVGEPQFMSIAAGRRERFWVGNCIALGAAALQIEPLAGGELHFAQIGLATLLDLFPLDARGAGEDFEFNRIVGEYADSLRDYTLACYRLSRRPGSFWEAVRATEPPQTLAVKLDLFAASGRIDIRDHEIFEEMDWAWLFMGAGLAPRALEWQMARAVAVVKHEQVIELRDYVGKLVSSMPRHVEYLQRVKSAPPRAPGADS